MNGRTRRAPDERGAATLVGLSLIALLLFVAYAAGGAVTLVAVHRKAQSAADLAALAAAQALQRGEDACTAGEAIAAAQGVNLSGCSIQGLEVVVVASIRLSPFFGRSSLEGRARAGPAP